MFENKECALDTRNCFTFVVSHWTEDNRLSQYFIESDFSVVMSFCGSTNILKINLRTCILFGANSYFSFFFFSYKEVFSKTTYINRSLKFFFSSYLKRVLEWNLSASGTPFKGFIDANHTLKFQDRCMCINIQLPRRTVRSTNLGRVGCIEEVFRADNIKNYSFLLFHG